MHANRSIGLGGRLFVITVLKQADAPEGEKIADVIVICHLNTMRWFLLTIIVVMYTIRVAGRCLKFPFMLQTTSSFYKWKTIVAWSVMPFEGFHTPRPKSISVVVIVTDYIWVLNEQDFQSNEKKICLIKWISSPFEKVKIFSALEAKLQKIKISLLGSLE